MPRRFDISSIRAIGAGAKFLAALPALGLATPAVAQDAWTIQPTVSMSRTVDNVTLAYTRHRADDDTLSITVHACGDEPWHMEESINGVTVDGLRDSVKEELQNAHLNCKIADDVDTRMMAGFDDAFAKVKAFLPPRAQTVGGWKLEDKGGMPGDDSERSVTMTKVLPVVTMRYQASGTSDGASFSLECKGASYGGGFDFGNPPEDHVKVVNQEMAEDYADFAKDCKGKPETQAELMQDFPEALATLEGWLKAKPFVYPPDNSSKQ